MSLSVERRLPDEVQRRAVLDLAARVEHEDGAPPLSDQTRARLTSPEVTHLLALDEADVVGYGQLDDGSFELTAEPVAVDALLEAARPQLVWSHGRRSRLLEPLGRHGFERIRELHQLRRPLADLPQDPPLPEDVTVRAFEPGRDDAGWLALNAAAFVHHREQGGMTQADLDARMTEPWFDPNGFLLADRAGELVAFHWTKIHPDGAGEVYVLGVAPQAQGSGLGSALLTRGLRHLRAAGCVTCLLYVDGDNPTALRLYERDGFARYDLDVQWRLP